MLRWFSRTSTDSWPNGMGREEEKRGGSISIRPRGGNRSSAARRASRGFAPWRPKWRALRTFSLCSHFAIFEVRSGLEQRAVCICVGFGEPPGCSPVEISREMVNFSASLHDPRCASKSATLRELRQVP